MRHWLACGEVALVVEAAGEAAEGHLGGARFSRAKGTYAVALRAARGSARDDLMGPLIAGYVEAALADSTLNAAQEAERHAARMEVAPGPQLVALAEAFRHGLLGDWVQAWETASAIQPFSTSGLEVVRIGVLVRAATLGQIADVDGLLAGCAAFFEGTASGRAAHLSWRGLVAYNRGELAVAVELQRAALAEAPPPRRRLAVLSNLCVALLDNLQFEEAWRLAAEVERWGAAVRNEAAERQGLDLDPLSEDLRAGIWAVGRDLTSANLMLTFAVGAGTGVARARRRPPDRVSFGSARQGARRPRARSRSPAPGVELARSAGGAWGRLRLTLSLRLRSPGPPEKRQGEPRRSRSPPG